nr:hypothetical protein [Rhodococcus erythropolis]
MDGIATVPDTTMGSPAAPSEAYVISWVLAALGSAAAESSALWVSS